MEFGDKIRYLRELRGMTLADVEEATGISRSYVSNMENGRAPLDEVVHGKIKALANALRCKVEFLVREDLVSYEELAETSGVTLPDDMINFLSNQANLPYLQLAKKALEQGVPAETAQKAINDIRWLMDEIGRKKS